jgi:hypothetical protein
MKEILWIGKEGDCYATVNGYDLSLKNTRHGETAWLLSKDNKIIRGKLCRTEKQAKEAVIKAYNEAIA